MGNSSSAPTPTSQHVFAADTPVSFSEGLVNKLQNSRETDSTRSKDLELKIQSRVTEELEKLLANSNAELSKTSDAVSNEPFTPPPPPKNPEQSPGFAEKPLLNRLYEKVTGHADAGSSVKVTRPDLDSNAVQSDIEKLKQKLAGVKQLRELDDGVKSAKEDVVKCLRTNDRRPLDCWKEVERFKTEVGRLEKSFIDRNGG